RLNSPFSRNAHELLMLSSEVEPLRGWGVKVTQAMEQLPELTSIDGERGDGAQQVVIDIDRDAAQRLGVDMAMVGSLLNNSFSQRQVSTIDRKSTRLNSSHVKISYAVFCLKKKKNRQKKKR